MRPCRFSLSPSRSSQHSRTKLLNFNRNNAASPRPPALADAADTYPGGWGLRREGNGVTPPRMIPGERPPGDLDALHPLQAEATFPTGEARYAMPPTCDGYPDVDTYRDLEFYILERAK